MVTDPIADFLARISNAHRADAFVSVHFNAAGPAHVRGIETYVLTPQFQRSTGSEKLRPLDEVGSPGNRHDAWNSYLGYTMHATLLKELELPDRGLKRARFEVLRELSCPGLLVEGGYLSHDEEAKLIATESYREKLAEAIVHGIAVYDGTLKRLAANRHAAGGG